MPGDQSAHRNTIINGAIRQHYNLLITVTGGIDNGTVIICHIIV